MLENLFEYSLSHESGKQQDKQANKIEKVGFMSTNSSVGLIGIATSLLRPYYASHIHRKDPKITVKHIVEQNNILRKLKRNGATINYERPPINE